MLDINTSELSFSFFSLTKVLLGGGGKKEKEFADFFDRKIS